MIYTSEILGEPKMRYDKRNGPPTGWKKPEELAPATRSVTIIRDTDKPDPDGRINHEEDKMRRELLTLASELAGLENELRKEALRGIPLKDRGEQDE
jgi:hypothetical protein